VNVRIISSDRSGRPSYLFLTQLFGTGFLEKLVVSQLVKKFPVFYGTCGHKSPPLDMLSYLNPVHTITPYFLKIHFITIIPSTPKSPE
jgi:hypothetical protein